MTDSAPISLDVARARAEILRLGAVDATAAAALSEELVKNPAGAKDIYARANNLYTRLTATRQTRLGYNPYDPAVVIAMKYHAVAASGRKEGDARTGDFSGIEKGLQALGVC